MKRVVATGRTVDEAVTSALVRLGVTRSQATIRVIREPVSRLFGILRSKDAEVEVTAVMTPEEIAKDFLTDTLEFMGVSARVRMRKATEEEEADETIEIACEEEMLPIVIGRHGVTLDSLQYLVNAVANRGQEKHVRFRVDAGDYRRRRREGLWEIAQRAAERALRTKKAVTLESMPASERKVIHTFLQDRSDVTTTSEGSEPNRKVIVVPVGVGETSKNQNRHRSQSSMRNGRRRDAQ